MNREQKLQAITKAIDNVVPSYEGERYGIREIMLWIKEKHKTEFYFSLHSNYPFGETNFYKGNLVLHFQFKREYSKNVPYNLEQDSLEKQSDEFIDFLYSLTQP